MALLLILFAVFGFVFAGLGSSTSHSGSATVEPRVVQSGKAQGDLCSNRMTAPPESKTDTGDCRYIPANP
jgi:hypothetical protein